MDKDDIRHVPCYLRISSPTFWTGTTNREAEPKKVCESNNRDKQKTLKMRVYKYSKTVEEKSNKDSLYVAVNCRGKLTGQYKQYDYLGIMDRYELEEKYGLNLNTITSAYHKQHITRSGFTFRRV